MKPSAIEAGARVASVLIHAEHKAPPILTQQDRADLASVIQSLTVAMRDVRDGSVYQATRKVLRAHLIAGTSTVTRIHPDRRRPLAAAIARGFAIEHLRSLAQADAVASGGAS